MQAKKGMVGLMIKGEGPSHFHVMLCKSAPDGGSDQGFLRRRKPGGASQGHFSCQKCVNLNRQMGAMLLRRTCGNDDQCILCGQCSQLRSAQIVPF